MKTAASIAALAALGLVAVNYSSNDSTQLFLSNQISEEEAMFFNWVKEWNKSYGTKEEYKLRQVEFKKTLAKIAAHNMNPKHKSTVGLNNMSDWTEEEYKQLLGFKPEMKTKKNPVSLIKEGVSIPT